MHLLLPNKVPLRLYPQSLLRPLRAHMVPC
nr:MAG TPA: hypothetical protein [Caudoviricetes sp.]